MKHWLSEVHFLLFSDFILRLDDFGVLRGISLAVLADSVFSLPYLISFHQKCDKDLMSTPTPEITELVTCRKEGTQKIW